MAKSFAGFFAASNPKLAETLRKSMETWGRIAGNAQAVMGLSLSQEKLFHWIEIVASDHAEEIATLLADNAAKMNEASAREGLRQNGIDCSYTIKKAVRQIEGRTVDSLETDCRLLPGHPASASADVVRRMYPTRMEWLLAPPYFVAEINGHDLDDVVHDLFHGQPHGEALAATEAFPQSGFFHGDLDVAAVINGARALSERPTFAPVNPARPIAFTGYARDGAAEYRMRLPNDVVAEIISLFQQIAPKPAKPAH